MAGSPTFQHNVLECAVDGYADNTVGDPLFTAIEEDDFTLTGKSSAAYGIAVQPATPVDVDFVLFARGATAACAGAYEYDPSGDAFDVAIKVTQELSLKGRVPAKAKAEISGAEEAECTVQWYLDGAKAGTAVEQTFLPEAYGYHNLRVVVRHGTLERECPTAAEDPVRISTVGDTVYVGGGETPTYPYVTAKTAAADFATAYAALWKSADVTSCVSVATGTFPAGSVQSIAFPVVVAGEGAAKSRLTGAGFTVNHADAILRDLTVADVGGRGVYLHTGAVRNCVITNCVLAGNGAGVYVAGGILSGCTITDCRVAGPYTAGGGVYLKDGTVSNCVIVACDSNSSASRANSNGAGARVDGGVFVNNIVRACGSSAANQQRMDVALHQEGGTVRGCLFVGNLCPNTSAAPSVYVKSGSVFESCTVVDNTAGLAAVEFEGGTFINTLIYQNTAPAQMTGKTPSYCCYPEAVEGENGNRVASGRIFCGQSKGNYYPLKNSPCFNAGINQSWMNGANDINGKERIRCGTVDIGAYEKFFQGLVITFK